MVRVDRRKHGEASSSSAATTTDLRALNAQLAQAATPEEIEALVRTHCAVMNSVNVATALHRLAKCRPARSKGGGMEALLCARTAAVLAGAENVTPRSLTSIAWAVGKLRLSDAPLLAALVAQASAQLARGGLDAFGIANVAWALATLYTAATSATTETVSPQHGGLCDALAEAALARPQEFKPQELTNLLWAFATLKRRHARLFEALGEVATGRMGEFTPQGLSQTVWAFSKLNLSKHSLLLAAAAAALPRLASYDPQSVATLAWAFANLEVEHRPLMAAVSQHASARPTAFDSASASQLLWALSRLSDGVEPLAVEALARRLREVASAGLEPKQLLYALGALAKLPPSTDGELPAVLCSAAIDAAPQLTANRLGIAAWSLSRPSVLARLPAATAAAWSSALRARAVAVADYLGWRSIGHVEVAPRHIHAYA